jgi:hypothetical protein
VQEYYDVQDKRGWVEWAGKVLMLHLHAQIVMEKADAVRAEQEEAEELQEGIVGVGAGGKRGGVG